MPSWVISLIIAAAVVVVVFLVMRHLNKRAEAKQAEQSKAIEQYKQTVNMMVIDKKMMRLNQTDLPAAVKEGTPWYGKLFKLPVVKAKIGPKIVTLIADKDIFELIPLKKEVKATISGLYITNVRGIRGPLEHKERKRNWFQKLMGEK